MRLFANILKFFKVRKQLKPKSDLKTYRMSISNPCGSDLSSS